MGNCVEFKLLFKLFLNCFQKLNDKQTYVCHLPVHYRDCCVILQVVKCVEYVTAEIIYCSCQYVDYIIFLTIWHFC